jgi:hypothetical protein
MRNKVSIVGLAALFLGLALSVSASTPIATVTSVEPFLLDGHSVETQSITSYPLAVGSELATGAGAAVVVFEDGSSVKLAAGSRARLTGSEKLPKLVLLAGSLDYKLILGSNLSVTSLDLERTHKPAALPPVAVKPLRTPRPDDVTFTSR